MDKHNIIDLMLKAAMKMKPILRRFLPMNVLRGIKRRIIDASIAKMNARPLKLRFIRSANPDGINLIGYIKAEMGLGQSCRLVAGGLETAGIPFTVYNYEQASIMRYNDQTWAHKITNTTPYNINLFHLNPYEMPSAFLNIGRGVWRKRYNIAFWLWELEEFPAEWEEAFKLVDEVWAPSEFTSNCVRKVTDKPVHTMPYALRAPECGEYRRRHFELPENLTLFLCMYDCNSTMARKNPIGAVKAFKKAFGRDNVNVGIIVKVNNAKDSDIVQIKTELDGYPGVYIFSEVMDKVKVNGLIACADVLISLHRAEGFGLVPAEAMFLGTPVVSTNWSSTTEFMNHDVTCLVDYEFVEIKESDGPYPSGSRWAEPNINQAADYLKKLYDDEEYRNNLAKKAKQYIEGKFAPESMALLLSKRIAEIYDTVASS